MAWNSERFGKDDPWAMAKLAGVVAKSKQEVDSAAKKQKAAAAEYSAARARGMHADRFAMVRVAVDGSNRQWGAQRGKTNEECRDAATFPLGLQMDSTGPYVWQQVLEDCLR